MRYKVNRTLSFEKEIKMSRKIYTWFVGPKDKDTNETISQELSEENFLRGITCADGKKHNLWRCSFEFISMLSKSKVSLNLNFDVFNKEGKYGKIRKSPSFLLKKRRKNLK